MKTAIRIIRSPRPSDANLFAVEREEQILAVAKHIAEANGTFAAEDIEACAAKFRQVRESSTHRTPDQIADDISAQLHSRMGHEAIHTQSEIDLFRIMELLKG